MAGDVQKLAGNVKQAVIAAMLIYAAVCIYELFGQGSAFGVVPGVLAGLTYWFVYSKLTTDVTTARYAAIVIACLAAADIVLGLVIISSPGGGNPGVLFVSLADVVVIACFAYTAVQLQQMAGSGIASASGVPAPPQRTGLVSSDVAEQLKKVAELHKQGVLTDAEFEAKKAELLKRI
jgi:hypothetical protein